MNPLLATCGVGLLTMGLGAALTPDVLPTPVVPPATVSAAHPMEAAAPDAPSPAAERPEPELDAEVFSRRVLPPRTPPTLTRAAVDARIVGEVLTPLRRTALDVRSYSRVRLPRSVFRHEYGPDTARPKARKPDYVAFRLTRTTDRRPLDEPTVIAWGRVHRVTGAVELRLVADEEPVWHPAEAAVRRLARLR